MAYRIKPACPDIGKCVRRIAREQLSAVRRNAARGGKNPHKAVHETRKACKRMRALLRLVEPSFPEFSREDKAVRTAARGLSRLRDAAAMSEAFEALAKWAGAALPDEEAARVREALAARKNGLQRREGDAAAQLARAGERLGRIERRTRDWRFTARDADAVLPGLARTYRHGRKTMFAAYRDGGEEGFHRWRRQVKHLGHHADLLRDVCGNELQETARLAARLGEVLGEEHDLSVLRGLFADEPGLAGGREPAEALMALADIRQCEVRAEARGLGAELYAGTRKDFIARCQGSWGRGASEQAAPDEVAGQAPVPPTEPPTTPPQPTVG